MEHKSVLMLRNRIVQLESQHNNLNKSCCIFNEKY